MLPYIEFFDWPVLPDHLLEKDGKVVQEKFKDSHSRSELDIFSLHLIENKELLSFIQPYFNFNVEGNSYYQIVGKVLGRHMDVSRTEAWNYIIDPGGDNVLTQWFQTKYGDDKLFEICIPPRKWHRIQVDIQHNVVNQIRPRLSISVYLKNDFNTK